MAAAYFIAHAPQGFWPILNGGELAITFSWLSLYFAAHGPGAWAVDNLRSRVPAGQARVAPVAPQPTRRPSHRSMSGARADRGWPGVSAEPLRTSVS